MFIDHFLFKYNKIKNILGTVIGWTGRSLKLVSRYSEGKCVLFGVTTVGFKYNKYPYPFYYYRQGVVTESHCGSLCHHKYYY